jgi:hypothetical protein
VVFVKVQLVTGVVPVVAEILLSVAPGVLVLVVISGTVWVKVDSFSISLVTEVVSVEVCATKIGVAQVVANNRFLALVKTPSSGLLFLLYETVLFYYLNNNYCRCVVGSLGISDGGDNFRN